MTTDELIARDALYRFLGEHVELARDLDYSEWIAGFIDAQRASEADDSIVVPATKSSLYIAGWNYYLDDAMIDQP